MSVYTDLFTYSINIQGSRQSSSFLDTSTGISALVVSVTFSIPIHVSAPCLEYQLIERVGHSTRRTHASDIFYVFMLNQRPRMHVYIYSRKAIGFCMQHWNLDMTLSFMTNVMDRIHSSMGYVI